ncbi:hypothetical protein AKJ45_00585 [candidate division MSBL1 archaeon SCGC-AAA261F19]|uniref:Bifunctional protein GlmU n=2 Tax=candidate division MSBL1 TaxID=215777 RepID=A0A133VBB0_9EURY|nr:hypothetical protein AKJ43_02805 [candidate division MSBL1 archaeon SCGC-AAA261D19]KXB03736.1 hypothetical protein AKJ45_00585 [candidate division MSBL1 archaeon SCGC-AAA261F19]
MKAVVLAAGVGERMSPLTDTRSKMLIPVAGKPILEYVFESLRGADITDVTVVVGYQKKSIIDYFGDGRKFGMKLDYVEQPEPKGTAHAISVTSMDDTFVTINGDVYCDAASLVDTIKKHEDEGDILTMGAYKVKSASSYGVIRTKNGRVTGVIEKPKKTSNRLINAGVYIFEPEIYDAIRKTPYSERGEKEITTSIGILIESGKPITVNRLDSWVHIGRPWDILQANEQALRVQKPAIECEIEPNAHVAENVRIESGTQIRSGSYIEGPTYIGKDCDIGPNCYIRPYTSISENVRIGNAVEVKNSVIMEGTHAAHHSYIGDSIVGANCNFGSGTKVGNLRLDAGNIMMTLREGLADTGRRKLGAVLGDGVQTGINSMINPGVKLGQNSAIGPGVVLTRDLQANRCVLVEQKEREEAWKK